jgi:hypothetical protein
MKLKKDKAQSEIIVYGHQHSLKLISIDDKQLDLILSEDGLRIKGQESDLWRYEVDGDVISGIFENILVGHKDEDIKIDIPEVDVTHEIRGQSFIVAYEGQKIWYQGKIAGDFDVDQLKLDIAKFDLDEDSEPYLFVNVTYPDVNFEEINSKSINEGFFLIDPSRGIVQLEIKDDDETGFVLVSNN